MKIEVNVLKNDGIRKPDYEGSYKVVEDLGDTMIIEVEPKLEERLEKTEELIQVTTMALTEFIFNQTMGKQHDDN